MLKQLLSILVLLSGLLGTTTSYAQITRMEPPNWWTGMKHNTIEIMFYGNDIAKNHVTLSHPTVKLKGQTSLDNPNYLFVTVEIPSNTLPGNLDFQFTGSKKKGFTQSYPIYARESGRADIKGFDASDVLYLITPDRFRNGDPSNDAVKGLIEQPDRTNIGGRHGGDIEGMRQSLDYIGDMGFTAIWINPVLENNMDDYSYHGYATTDFYKVDPRYGTNEDYKNFVKEAKSKNIKVIMDMIVNHSGLSHWWMKDLPASDWINVWPEYQETSHQKTVIQDPYATQKDKKIFFDGWFVPTMPDLNQRNETLARYLIQNSLWWIEYSAINGIRMDTYPYPDMDFMTKWTQAVMAEYPDFNIVGEEWIDLPQLVSYWQKGKINPNGYESELKSLMDFPLQIAIVEALNNKGGWGSSWRPVYRMLAQDYMYPDPMNLVVFPDNHDMSRVYTQLNEDLDKHKMAMAFILTTRGIPQIYYGTETLQKNPGTGDHGVIRSDFPGGWEGDKVNAFTGKGLSDDQKSTMQYMKNILSWRKTSEAIHKGKLLHYIPYTHDTYVYFRSTDNDKVMVMLNNADTAATLNLEEYSEGLGTDRGGLEVISGKKVFLDKTFTVPPKSAAIIDFD